MSLIIGNRATKKQIELLKKLEYYGSLNLSVEEAAKIIDELFEEQRLDQKYENEGTYADYYNNREE